MKVCAYERKGSSFVWLKWIDPIEKRQVFESSKIRANDPQRERKLAKKINSIEGRLLDRAPNQDGEAFDHWTVEFLTKRHEKNPGSLHKNLNSWNYLSAYLREIGVSLPRELSRSHITGENEQTGYINWRCSQVKQKSKRQLSKNTALYDLRVLGKILNEANLRGFCERNVARRLGITKDDTKEKPEILSDEQEKIEAALATAPDWMRISFRVAIETGLRFRETNLDLMRDVDLVSKVIIIQAPKGGRKRAFSRPLPSVLIPLLRELRTAGRRTAFDLPKGKNVKPLGMQWREFFDAAGCPLLSFHCTRVTFITRGCRNGVPENIMMKLVNHAGKEISRIYQRLNIEDVRKWVQ